MKTRRSIFKTNGAMSRGERNSECDREKREMTRKSRNFSLHSLHFTGKLLALSASRYLIAGLIVIHLLPLHLVGCVDKPPKKRVRLAVSEARNQNNRAEQPRKVPLRVAIAAVISPRESFKLYSQLLDYLSEKLERPAEFMQRGAYAEVNDLVRYGECDVAFVCGYAYVQGNRDFGMQILVVPQVQGKTVYHSYIIVPKDSSVKKLEDLRGKTFAFSDPLSNSGRLSPTYLLLEMGETPESFFKKFVFTYSHDNSIKAVAEKLVDGAAVDSLVYDYMIAIHPDLDDKIKKINVSPPYGIPPVVVHPQIDPKLKEKLQTIFLNMHKDKKGREILTQLMIDRFVLGDDSDYDSMREMAAKVGF
ncbi:MAG: phosphate/phosphite/phosphonate ABC transporter substrate-binding protein [Candidatus Poribacteria bacterium]